MVNAVQRRITKSFVKLHRKNMIEIHHIYTMAETSEETRVRVNRYQQFNCLLEIYLNHLTENLCIHKILRQINRVPFGFQRTSKNPKL